MITYRYVELSGAIGCEYTFEREGEYIPSHRHAPHLAHATRCITGRAWLETGGAWRVIREGEEAADWDPTLPHTVSALDPGTVIFNRLLIRPDEAMVADLLSDPGGPVEPTEA